MPMNPEKLRIIFMGTPAYAATTLSALLGTTHDVVAVFTQPDKPSGRGQKINSPACAQLAKEQGIPLYQPKTLKNGAAYQIIADLKPDLIIVVAYGLLLPKSILDTPTLGTVNLHASLLPKYRGAAPIQWALINGEKETGVTLMSLNEKMDEGDIYSQVKFPILASDNQDTLFLKCAKEGTTLLIKELPRLARHEIKSIKQDDTIASHARILKKEDGKINFNQSAIQLANLVHGLSHWPTAHTVIDNKMLKIYDAIALPDSIGPKHVGSIVEVTQSGILIDCAEGQLLVKEVQLEGKKRIAATEFARGYLRELPKQLGSKE